MKEMSIDVDLAILGQQQQREGSTCAADSATNEPKEANDAPADRFVQNNVGHTYFESNFHW